MHVEAFRPPLQLLLNRNLIAELQRDGRNMMAVERLADSGEFVNNMRLCKSIQGQVGERVNARGQDGPHGFDVACYERGDLEVL